MDYSAFNPTVWLVFIGFCAVTWLAVRAFHARYPDYPGHRDKDVEPEKNTTEVAL